MRRRDEQGRPCVVVARSTGVMRESRRGARLVPCVIVVRSRGVCDFGDLVIGP